MVLPHVLLGNRACAPMLLSGVGCCYPPALKPRCPPCCLLAVGYAEQYMDVSKVSRSTPTGAVRHQGLSCPSQLSPNDGACW